MIYDITGHPLLTGEATDLGPTQLDAHARVAETLLKLLTFATFDKVSQPDLYNRACDAVALQVTYQVESGVDAFIMSKLTRGGRSMNFRGGRRMPPIHAISKKIISAIKPVST